MISARDGLDLRHAQGPNPHALALFPGVQEQEAGDLMSTLQREKLRHQRRKQGARGHRLLAGSLGGGGGAHCSTVLSLSKKIKNISREAFEGQTALHGDRKASRSGGLVKCKFPPPGAACNVFLPKPLCLPGLSARASLLTNPGPQMWPMRKALGSKATVCAAVFMFAIKASRCGQSN